MRAWDGISIDRSGSSGMRLEMWPLARHNLGQRRLLVGRRGDNMENCDWQPFLRFNSRGSADAVAAVLQSEEVLTLVKASHLTAGIESDFVIFVPTHLAHRARWDFAQ